MGLNQPQIQADTIIFKHKVISDSIEECVNYLERKKKMLKNEDFFFGKVIVVNQRLIRGIGGELKRSIMNSSCNYLVNGAK